MTLPLSVCSSGYLIPWPIFYGNIQDWRQHIMMME